MTRKPIWINPQGTNKKKILKTMAEEKKRYSVNYQNGGAVDTLWVIKKERQRGRQRHDPKKGKKQKTIRQNLQIISQKHDRSNIKKKKKIGDQTLHSTHTPYKMTQKTLTILLSKKAKFTCFFFLLWVIWLLQCFMKPDLALNQRQQLSTRYLSIPAIIE